MVTRPDTFSVCRQHMEDAMACRRVTREERGLVCRWRREGCRVREVARRLGRARGSISRELLRNLGRRGCRLRQAHRKARDRARRSGPWRFAEAARVDVGQRLREGGAPEIIGGRARLEGRPRVCKETIRRHVHADAKAGGELRKNLPRARRKRRRRCPRIDGRGRGRIPGRRMIDTRPAEVETRAVVGHREGDPINGAAKRGRLVTAVDSPAPRDAPQQAGWNTRFALVGRTDQGGGRRGGRGAVRDVPAGAGDRAQGADAGQRQGVRPPRGDGPYDGHGRVLRAAVPLVGTGHERECRRTDSRTLPQAVVVRPHRGARTASDRPVDGQSKCDFGGASATGGAASPSENREEDGRSGPNRAAKQRHGHREGPSVPAMIHAGA
jgi:hypothetical protein